MRQQKLRRLTEVALYTTSPLATLVTAPILARGLDPVGRGEYGLISAVTAFLLTVGAWGQTEAILSEARAGHRTYRAHVAIATTGSLVAAALALAALVALKIEPLTALAAVVWMPLMTRANLWRSVALTTDDLRGPALMNFYAALIRVVALGALSLTGTLSVITATIASQASVFFAGLFATYGSVRQQPVEYRAAHTSNQRSRLLRNGGGVVAFDLLNAVALRADLVVLQLLSTSYQLGLYAAPASVSTASLALSMAFRTRLQSLAIRAAPRRAIVREFGFILAIGAVGAVALWLAAPLIVDLLFGPAYRASVLPLQILGLAVVPLLLFDAAQAVLVVTGTRVQLIACGAVASTSTLVALIVLVGTLHDAASAAAASFLSNAVSAAFALAVVFRRKKATA